MIYDGVLLREFIIAVYSRLSAAYYYTRSPGLYNYYVLVIGNATIIYFPSVSLVFVREAIISGRNEHNSYNRT